MTNGRLPQQHETATEQTGRWASRPGRPGREKIVSRPRDLEPDTLDRQIISLLQADGRCSNREIARQLDVPEATVRYRVRRLTDGGLLRITALVAPEHLGYQLTVVITVQVEAQRVNEVAETLGALPEVMWLVITSGEKDIILTAAFQGQEQLFDFLTDELAIVPGIIRSETAIGLKVVKRDCQWAFDLTTEVSTVDGHLPVHVG
jgi:Lrp/AsnC family transcriptional regulator for asnA, asnC and gidA